VRRPTRPRAPRQTRNPDAGYGLIVRGPDGRVRVRRFDDAADYRDGVRRLGESGRHAISIDDLVTLLENS
jgi:hypothetical protein